MRSVISFSACFLLASPICYLIGSIWESYFHELVLDRPLFTKCRGYRKDGWLSELWFARFSHHVVHHHLTYRQSHVRQFRAPADEPALTEKLRRLLDGSQFRSVIASRFGARVVWTGACQFALPLIVLGLCAAAVGPHDVRRAALLLAIVFGTTPYFIFSKWIHMYLHEPWSHVARAPRVLRPLLRSRYGMAMRIGHFVHHRHPDSNYNLQLGFDLLRRRWRPPDDAEWDEMLALGLVTPQHRSAMQNRRILLHPF